ncbi:hypothetical protein WJX73_001876 [Symbiochloris irregularis]|uniref:Uncharacterized protein n=1 Tax=Symbiochloris irregularis TaxID=706552 RepID=A0AAW1P3Q6_9CHLO
MSFSPVIPPEQEGNIEVIELRRESFAGRVAILTLGAMLLGERLSGKGIVATFNGNTNIALWEVEPLLAFGILALVFVGLYPSKTPLVYPLLEEGANASTFWRAAQRILGRLACLLLAGTILMEILTGKGALKLFNIETGKETLDEAEIAIAFFALLFLTAGAPDDSEDD